LISQKYYVCAFLFAQVRSKLRCHSKRITCLPFANVLNVLVSSGPVRMPRLFTELFVTIYLSSRLYSIVAIFKCVVFVDLCLEHGCMGEAKEQNFANTIKSVIQHLRYTHTVPLRSNALSGCARNPKL
jgi:hypothetical protein